MRIHPLNPNAICIGMLFFSYAHAQSKTYTALRDEVLSAIGTAKQRVCLVSDLFTDGEIATSLFVAQYRKLEVVAVLGKANTQSYTSRLRYLRAQNIPVGPRDRAFPVREPTALIVDDRLARVDGNLDAYASYKSFNVSWMQSQSEADRIYEACKKALGGTLRARELPNAGQNGAYRRRPGDEAYRPDSMNYSVPSNTAEAQNDAVHRPSVLKSERPKDVPDKLPKVPLWQRRIREDAE